jgi:hypothetical protein
MLLNLHMGHRIPPTLKKKVIQEWLLAYSRDEIAVNNNISSGAVTSIIKQFKGDIPDIDLLRETALLLKKGNLDLNHFVPSIRLKNMLDKLGFSEEMVESLLEDIETHCFRNQMDEKEFVSKIDEVSKLVDSLEISINEIPSYIDQKRGESENLDVEISNKHKKILKLMSEYDTTKEDLENFRSSRPLLEKISKLEDELKAKDEEMSLQRKKMLEYRLEIHMSDYSRSISESELYKANELLSEEGEPLDEGEWTSGCATTDVKELSALADEVCQHPSRNIDIIKLLRDRRQSQPEN